MKSVGVTIAGQLLLLVVHKDAVDVLVEHRRQRLLEVGPTRNGDGMTGHQLRHGPLQNALVGVSLHRGAQHRRTVTHEVALRHDADNIAVFNDGRMAEASTLEQVEGVLVRVVERQRLKRHSS